VINKIDLVNESELAEILAFVSETIRIQIGRDHVNLFPVSARKALDARLSGDVSLYEQSGLKSLEEALASFLSDEKSVTFLSVVAQKAMRVVDDETAQNTFGEAALQARAVVMKQKDFVTLRRDPHISAEAIMQARLKLEALYKSNIEGKWAEEHEPEPLQPIATETIPEAKSTFPASMAAAGLEADKATDMDADMLRRECPVCHHITEVASDFFSQWQYHIAAEEHAQAEFAEELGFCPLHTWQLLAKSSPHGASIGFAPLAEEVARRIRKFHEEPITGDKVKQMVHNSRNCRVCELLRRAEMEYIQKIAALLNDSEGRNTYLRSQGACLRHIGMLMDMVSTDGIREFLLSDAARHFEEDAVDMRSYAMKREALRRALQNSNEVDAYRRAIIRMVGGKGVYVPWDP
jgi:hypothetical protein